MAYLLLTADAPACILFRCLTCSLRTAESIVALLELPALHSLDLSSNKLAGTDVLDAVCIKLQQLLLLRLTGNPVVSDTDPCNVSQFSLASCESNSRAYACLIVYSYGAIAGQ